MRTDMTEQPGAVPLLEVKELKKWFEMPGGVFSGKKNAVRAVDGVDMKVRRGETVALVGESGCGKSTLGRTIVRLFRPTSGTVIFDGADMTSLRGEALARQRRHIQFIFQDPFASLDPRMTVGDVIGEPIDIFKACPGRKERNAEVLKVMETVGLEPVWASRYSHEFSGGQRQRICIARAIALRPKLVVCDEPVSALDVSIQAQIINLLKNLQKQFQMAYIFISHDLNVVRHISDKVCVMYLGKFVETADKRGLFESPRHPYTKALLSAIPLSDPRTRREKIVLSGDIPNPANPPEGCRFHTRCPIASQICRETPPPATEVSPGHFASCHKL
jgi:oligopeptide/dipeptide ABC transporter ATP-binding protein